MNTIKIVNVETGEEIEREMTASELEQKAKDEQTHLEYLQAKAEAEAKRQALLDKLGITEDEARLLLGGN